MSSIGWLILAVLVILVILVVVAAVKWRSRRGGVIATKPPRRGRGGTQ